LQKPQLAKRKWKQQNGGDTRIYDGPARFALNNQEQVIVYKIIVLLDINMPVIDGWSF
jgi:CheY-like chemotaxis protein